MKEQDEETKYSLRIKKKKKTTLKEWLYTLPNSFYLDRLLHPAPTIYSHTRLMLE